jgi:hypothetical protein
VKIQALRKAVIYILLGFEAFPFIDYQLWVCSFFGK